MNGVSRARDVKWGSHLLYVFLLLCYVIEVGGHVRLGIRECDWYLNQKRLRNFYADITIGEEFCPERKE